MTTHGRHATVDSQTRAFPLVAFGPPDRRYRALESLLAGGGPGSAQT